MLPNVLQEWRQPRHEEFEARNLFSLQQAFTETFKDRQLARPNEAAQEVVRLTRFLENSLYASQQHSTAV